MPHIRIYAEQVGRVVPSAPPASVPPSSVPSHRQPPVFLHQLEAVVSQHIKPNFVCGQHRSKTRFVISEVEAHITATSTSKTSAKSSPTFCGTCESMNASSATAKKWFKKATLPPVGTKRQNCLMVQAELLLIRGLNGLTAGRSWKIFPNQVKNLE